MDMKFEGKTLARVKIYRGGSLLIDRVYIENVNFDACEKVREKYENGTTAELFYIEV